MPCRLVFSTTADGLNSPTERMRIDSTGAIVLPNGSPGIQFGTVSSPATSTNLDDYEEGTFTPAFINAGTATYAIQAGHYSKVGNVVTATVFIQFANAGTASGHVVLSGLPYISKNASNLYAISSSFHGTGWSITRNSMNVVIPPGQATTNVFYYNMAAAGATYGQVQHSDLGLGNTLLSFTYLAN